MAIIVFCPTCGVRLTLGDDRAGGAVECPRCNTALGIPALLLPTPPKPPPLPASAPVPPTPSATEDETDADDDPPPPRRRGKRLTLHPALWVAVGLLALVGVILLGRGVLLSSGLQGPGGGSGEMDQSSLTELVTDLHRKPDVNGIVTYEAGSLVEAAQAFLPPDRRYDGVALSILLKSAPGSSPSVFLVVIDCTSAERAVLLVERFKASMANDPDVDRPKMDRCFRSSGRFFILGDEPSIKWIARYYRLRSG